MAAEYLPRRGLHKKLGLRKRVIVHREYILMVQVLPFYDTDIVVRKSPGTVSGEASDHKGHVRFPQYRVAIS